MLFECEDCRYHHPKNAGRAGEFALDRLGIELDEVQLRLLMTPRKQVAMNCTRQCGKSTVGSLRALRQAWTAPESLTLAVSPSERQSRMFVRKVREFARRLGVKPRGDGDNPISVMLPNGSRVVGVPGNEETVRGFSAVSLVVIDEAARVPDAMYEAVLPMLAVKDGDLWLLSTPRGQRGFFYEEWVKGGDDWERVMLTATECPRISAAFLEKQKKRRGEEWFRKEYLCEFVADANALFDRDKVEALFTKEVKVLEW